MLFQEHMELYQEELKALDRSPRTIDGYMQDLSFFRKWLEQTFNCPVYTEDITLADVDAFLKMLREERAYKPASMKKMHIVLKKFFQFALKKKWCTEDIASEIRPVRIPQNERDYLSEDEVMTFIEQMNHRLGEVVILTIYYTGLRIAEAVALNVDDVDLQERKIFVQKGKGNKSRTIPISDKLATILVEYEQWRVDSDAYFATKKTGRLSKVRIQRLVRDTRETLGWRKHVTPHTFRHSFASRLVEKDVNIVRISKLLGHADLKTTSVYTHASMSQLEEAVNHL
jgi:integrase/recombinase XerD